ncbi:hypothetical protein N658DRAFT_520207 [Parathielavia hyrcaniae]|uniref:RNase MRP protein 1 RNA binding domain-containing protein n=1 Tax=Parathielavia hyrcaniae TaxID=113614 RepID=A0AAN6T7E5_9PEZI|nr:hypothetical protein N658DRAFT_520207 [Parathielavia hyrcaniae]
MAEPALEKAPDLLPPAVDPAILSLAIASLAPALELLERFHHRNKNQHRIAKWWAQADMLRRHVRKMLGELEAAVEPAEKAARAKERQRVKGTGKGKSQKLVEAVGEENMQAEVLRKRAGYLRWRLGPGAFLAFTQLSADRQFAHLGLMLLGVLAQVDKVIAPFAPPQRETVDEETREQAAAAAEVAAGKDSAVGADDDTMMETDTDMGVAVSRDEIMASIERDPAPTPIPSETLPPTEQAAKGDDMHPRSISLPINSHPSPIRQPLNQTRAAKTEPASKEPSITPAVVPSKPKTKKVHKSKDDRVDGISGSVRRPLASKPTPPATADTPAEEPSSKESSAPGPGAALKLNKKKKKARDDEAGGGGGGNGSAKGDNFDNIFASLDAKSKKPKKKKRKKGDEFDDIFGGL